MSAYHKNPEFDLGWPAFLPPPDDPRWPKWAVVMLVLFLVGAILAFSQLLHLLLT